MPKEKIIKAWAIMEKESRWFMPIWVPWVRVFSLMIFNNKESAQKLLRDKTYSKISRITKVEIKLCPQKPKKTK